jgi:hypothetical protein
MLATERPIQLVGVRHAPHTRLHVEFDRTLIEHHTRLLETYRTEGRDTSSVEHFIEAFEGSQKVFEWDLADLERRRDSSP